MEASRSVVTGYGHWSRSWYATTVLNSGIRKVRVARCTDVRQTILGRRDRSGVHQITSVLGISAIIRRRMEYTPGNMTRKILWSMINPQEFP